MNPTSQNNGDAYGPQNPHPLSQLQTELVWEGKYDEYGDRRTVDAAGLAMPMQRIETIDEPRARVEAQGDLFDTQKAHLDDFRNKLIWGDNKLVMASLLKEYKGAVDLIYIDPPFDVGADFTMDIPIGEANEQIFKDQSALELVAYRDTWGKGAASYLQMMAERMVLMRDLLSDQGSIYVHCDWRMNSALRLVMEELFVFQNAITWKRTAAHNDSKRIGKVSDTLLYFTRSDTYTWNPQYKPYDQKYLDSFYRHTEPDGRRYRLHQIERNPALGIRRNLIYEYNGYTPSYGWMVERKRLEQMDQEGRLVWSKRGKPSRKIYLGEGEEQGQPIHDIWDDIAMVGSQSAERVDYATQKPEALLERIINGSSNKGDLVADFFCGGGTTGAVAERLGRRWIIADLGRFAVHTSRKRLIEQQRALHGADQSYRAFDVLNLGRYERQWWQKESLEGADLEHRRIVLEFFKAELLPSPPSPLLHGRKGAAFCHVDSIDSIFTRDEAKAVSMAAADGGAKHIYCLSWEFEMDLRLECNRLEQEFGIEIKLIQIPREIMEKNRKEPPPFLEVATLTAEPVFGSEGGKKIVDIELTSFIPSLSEVPTKELETLRERAVKSGFDFIDFWAVDFDFKNGDPFHHDWQDYRLRKDRSLKTTSEQRHVYAKPGTYTACVKIVDIFGCDTSVTVEVPYG